MNRKKTRLARIARQAAVAVWPSVRVIEVYYSDEDGNKWLAETWVPDQEGRWTRGHEEEKAEEGRRQTAS